MGPEFAVCTFLASFLVLVPLPWLWKTRNYSAMILIAWLSITNLIYGINAVMWRHSVEIKAVVYCDITTKLLVGANIGIPLSCLCISIHLERLSSFRPIRMTPVHNRRRMIFDLSMCFGIPAIYMALHIIVQGHRFDIYQGSGCRPTLYACIPAIFLMWIPPLFVSTLSFIYAVVALRHFVRCRLLFAKYLADFVPSLTMASYLRLLLMVIVQIFGGITMMSITIWVEFKPGIQPWGNWAFVHSNFWKIRLFPYLVMDPFFKVWAERIIWGIPISAFVFFVFFSFTEDLRKEYRSIFDRIRRRAFPRSISYPTFSDRLMGSGLTQGRKRSAILSITLDRGGYPNYHRDRDATVSKTDSTDSTTTDSSAPNRDTTHFSFLIIDPPSPPPYTRSPRSGRIPSQPPPAYIHSRASLGIPWSKGINGRPS